MSPKYIQYIQGTFFDGILGHMRLVFCHRDEIFNIPRPEPEAFDAMICYEDADLIHAEHRP